VSLEWGLGNWEGKISAEPKAAANGEQQMANSNRRMVILRVGLLPDRKFHHSTLSTPHLILGFALPDTE